VAYSINGHHYLSAGTYEDTLMSVAGCDSIIVTQLTVNPQYLKDNPQLICQGNPYIINGHHYDISGTYYDTLYSIRTGCDSIVKTQLTMVPVSYLNNPQNICSGSAYHYNGHAYTTEGVYYDTLLEEHGCWAITITHLKVNPVFSRTNAKHICDGEVYQLNGHLYSEEGLYHDTLRTVAGCDSIVITSLTVNEKPVTSPIFGDRNPEAHSTQIYNVSGHPGASYEWVIGNGTQLSGGHSNQITVKWKTGVVGGWINVIEMNTKGCRGSLVDAFIQISPTIGLTTIEQQSATLHIYPNPFLDHMQLDIQYPAATEAYLQLMDINGQLILKQAVHLAGGATTIELNGPEVNSLSGGVYFLRLQTNDAVISRKLIKMN
jgi:hypothetical protein